MLKIHNVFQDTLKPRKPMPKSKQWFIQLVIGVTVFAVVGVTSGNAAGDRRAEREDLVREALKNAYPAVEDKRVLRAMVEVKRHVFVPKALQSFAYANRALPIGEGQTISQPYIVAFMTQALKLKGGEKVLEIGTGSGYQAAVLAEVVHVDDKRPGAVYTIEIVPELGKRAKKTLAELGYKNIHTKIGDGYLGWPEAAPFDAIVVTAAPEEVPKPLIEQLKVGGTLVIPVGRQGGAQKLKVITKRQKGVESKNVLDVVFVPMTGAVEEAR